METIESRQPIHVRHSFDDEAVGVAQQSHRKREEKTSSRRTVTALRLDKYAWEKE